MTIRILIADDQQLFRDGLRALIERENDMDVVHLVADGKWSEKVGNLLVTDLGELPFGRVGRFFFGNFKVLRYGLKNDFDL